jgi:putative SOS response-associated peptidase YedK
MCGRFTTSGAHQLAEDDGLGPIDFSSRDPREEILRPRFNVAPTQQIPALRILEATELRPERREIGLLRWGLVPWFAKEIGGRPLINARCETVHEKPSFKKSFERRRCLVPATGFYEWPRENGKKRRGTSPYMFRLKGGEPFAFAGIWDRWRSRAPDADNSGSPAGPAARDMEPVLSCAILTTRPNDCVADFHDRMPVILCPDQYRMWLDQDVDPEELQAALVPVDSALMERFPVSPAVNKVDNDYPELILPVPEEPRNLSLF